MPSKVPPFSTVNLFCFATLHELKPTKRRGPTMLAGTRVRALFDQRQDLVVPGVVVISSKAKGDALALLDGMRVAASVVRKPLLPPPAQTTLCRDAMSAIRAKSLPSLLVVADPLTLFTFLDEAVMLPEGSSWLIYYQEAYPRIMGSLYQIEVSFNERGARAVSMLSHGNMTGDRVRGGGSLIPAMARAA